MSSTESAEPAPADHPDADRSHTDRSHTDLDAARAALRAVPGVADAAVAVLPGRPGDQRLVALVVPGGADAVGSARVDPARTEPVLERAAAAGAAAVAAAGLGPADRAGTAELVARLDDAARAATAHALAASGLGRGEPRTTAEVCADLRAAPQHRWLVRRWLGDLAAVGAVIATPGDDGAGRWSDLHEVDERTLRRRCRELDRARRGLGYPAALTRFLMASIGRLPALLRAEVTVQGVLFPGATTATALGAYRDNPASRATGAACAELVRGLAEQAGAAGRRPLEVLEVGSGVGGTTDDVVDALAGLPACVHVTDLSRFFVDAARERLGDRSGAPRLRFGLLDVDEDLTAQGVPAGAVDVVLAANVLHNVRHVGHALAALRTALAPGGRLALVEFCRDHPYMTTSMAFMAGRVGAPDGSFVDARAGTGRIFLTVAEWEAELRAAGLVPEAVLPGPDSPLAPLAQHLLVARRPSADPAPAAPDLLPAARAALAAALPDAPAPSVHLVPALVPPPSPEEIR